MQRLLPFFLLLFLLPRLNADPETPKLIKTRYKNGRLKEKFYVIKDDVRHGAYTAWYKSGKKSLQTSFKNGATHGKLTRWDENGSRECRYHFNEGVVDGKVRHWHKNGKVKSDSFYVEGDPEGKTTTWFENGRKRSRAFFRDGKLSGKVVTRHLNGQKASESDYVDGALSGKSVTWHLNGKKASESAYKEDQMIDTLFLWYNTGSIKLKEPYRAGKKHGESIAFYETGAKKSVHSYYDGALVGESRRYYEDGGLRSVFRYKNGVYHGKAEAWYRNGKKRSEDMYENGVMHGRSLDWYETGGLKSKAAFREGRLDSIFTIWNKSGQVVSAFEYNPELWKTGVEDAPPLAKKSFAIDPALYESYCGKYEVEPAYIITITREGNNLYFQATRGGKAKPAIELMPETWKNFYLVEIAAQVSFVVEGDGKVNELLIAYSSVPIRARKISTIAAIMEAEEMILKNYKVLRHPNGRGIISLDVEKRLEWSGRTGTAEAAFFGQPGFYDISLVVVPENHKSPAVKLFIDGEKVMDFKYPAGGALWNNWGVDQHDFYQKRVYVEKGAAIKLIGESGQSGFARVDRIVFYAAVP
jgi:antitoxin component YwqK of YwqJK toxin-antitoxin module